MNEQYDIQDLPDGKRIRFAVVSELKARVFSDLMELLKDHIVSASLLTSNAELTGQFTDSSLRDILSKALNNDNCPPFRVWGDSCGVSHRIEHTENELIAVETKNLIFAKRIAKRHGIQLAEQLLRTDEPSENTAIETDTILQLESAFGELSL